jgi:hypothetical protein
VEPDGIVVKTKSGISKIYFQELPKEVQLRFNYDRQRATTYSAQQAASYAETKKQHEESRRQQEEASAHNMAATGQQ